MPNMRTHIEDKVTRTHISCVECVQRLIVARIAVINSPGTTKRLQVRDKPHGDEPPIHYWLK
jgi:hypothetical protein